MKRTRLSIMAIAALLCLAGIVQGGELALPPTHLLASGQPLDVQRDGHSAPFAGDFDGDGVFDLLVGQYEGGKLRVYRNLGTNAEPRFDGFGYFMAGGELGRVPEG